MAGRVEIICPYPSSTSFLTADLIAVGFQNWVDSVGRVQYVSSINGSVIRWSFGA